MSPEQRRVYLGQATQYDAFKTDVYELGRTAVALATLDLPVDPWSLDRLEQTAITHVQPLPYSPGLKKLLLKMLSERERARPTMRDISQESSSSALMLPQRLPGKVYLRPPEKVSVKSFAKALEKVPIKPPEPIFELSPEKGDVETRCVLCNKQFASGAFLLCPNSCYCFVCGPFLAMCEGWTHCGNCSDLLNSAIINTLASQKVKCCCGLSIRAQEEGHICRQGHVLCGKCSLCADNGKSYAVFVIVQSFQQSPS